MSSPFALVSLILVTWVTLRWLRVCPSAIITQTPLVFHKGAWLQHTHTHPRLQHKQTASLSAALKLHRLMSSSSWTGPSKNGMCSTSTDEIVFLRVCSYSTNILSVFIGWMLKGQKHREEKTDPVIIITGWETGGNHNINSAEPEEQVEVRVQMTERQMGRGWNAWTARCCWQLRRTVDKGGWNCLPSPEAN